MAANPTRTDVIFINGPSPSRLVRIAGISPSKSNRTRHSLAAIMADAIRSLSGGVQLILTVANQLIAGAHYETLGT